MGTALEPKMSDQDDEDQLAAEMEAANLDIANTTSRVNLNCRMYEQRFPEVEDVVIVQVRSIADMGAYVNLLEYNNIEGMILLSELSRRRIRSINKLIKVGRCEQCIVLTQEEFPATQREVLLGLWKAEEGKIHELLVQRSSWQPSLQQAEWRVDRKIASNHSDH